MENAIKKGKMRVMLLHHPQGGKKLKQGLQAHDYGAPGCFSSVITWHYPCYATYKI